ncbi:hypothetical protein OMP43_19485 [Sphingomonas sp. CBMAI 2297]|uniref:hypothetical protein n=1 Tax=Sphingomonas sp. CBMAI 2297 TaxID=2991720 RepID=UPI002458FC48|nr:hypothetical protein [Sphingomonas sp. CBMAI 2297]MDH4746215.1 hypothetical protein [Sphingomonas sp. CBMAI 2297]
MITEIPTAEDFYTAGINQLHLAWHLCMRAVDDYRAVTAHVDDDDYADATNDYWQRTQPALANAYGLIQQAIEMALKGRIAAVSPYLLVARDPKDWPKAVDTKPTPFSEFRTLDAADLIRVHNSVATVPFDDTFQEFWDDVRRERNKIMHSVTFRSFEPAVLIRTILRAGKALFADIPWHHRLLEMEVNGRYDYYGAGDSTRNVVMRQIANAIGYLAPKEAKLFLRFDKDARAYRCPSCCAESDREWHDGVPALAQFPPRSKAATELHCIVCDQTSLVQRLQCANTKCPADVIFEGQCLVCLQDQDSPYLFKSRFELGDPNESIRYRLDFRQGIFGRGGCSAGDMRNFADDEAAQEHARLAMEDSHLQRWETVSVSEDGQFSIITLGNEKPERLLGTWVRVDARLEWRPGFKPDLLPGDLF